eukprot:3158670-Rhodomonas_salina.2
MLLSAYYAPAMQCPVLTYGVWCYDQGTFPVPGATSAALVPGTYCPTRFLRDVPHRPRVLYCYHPMQYVVLTSRMVLPGALQEPTTANSPSRYRPTRLLCDAQY